MERVKLIVKYEYKNWNVYNEYETLIRATIIECTPSVIEDKIIKDYISTINPDAKNPDLLDITKL